MNNKTEAKKVTLRPSQTKKILRKAKKDYEGNFSMALRVMVDRFEDGTCENCKHYNTRYGKTCNIERKAFNDDDFECVVTLIVEKNDYCNKWEAKDDI
jgi:hypothetical protein